MTTTTEAAQAIACMTNGPGGTFYVRSGMQEAFDSIPCTHWVSHTDRLDIYAYDDGDHPDLLLAIPWDGESFRILDDLPEDSV